MSTVSEIQAALPNLTPEELRLNVRFLESGAFYVQGVLAVPSAKFVRRLGSLLPAQLGEVETVITRWLGLAE